MTRPLVAAALTAAALAAPAHAAPPSTNLVYTVTASAESPAALTATCVFRPDRWTADYGPTYIDGAAVTAAPGNVTHVRCLIYSWGDLVGDVSGSGGNVALIQGERVGVVASSPNIRVCVEASTASTLIDAGASASKCATP